MIHCCPVVPLFLWDPVVQQVQCHHLFLVIHPFQRVLLCQVLPSDQVGQDHLCVP